MHKNKKQKIINLILSVNLESTYLTEIENFLLKVLYIKLKVNWNNTMKLMNSNKNKLNNKKKLPNISLFKT